MLYTLPIATAISSLEVNRYETAMLTMMQIILHKIDLTIDLLLVSPMFSVHDSPILKSC